MGSEGKPNTATCIIPMCYKSNLMEDFCTNSNAFLLCLGMKIHEIYFRNARLLNKNIIALILVTQVSIHFYSMQNLKDLFVLGLLKSIWIKLGARKTAVNFNKCFLLYNFVFPTKGQRLDPLKAVQKLKW